MYGNTGRSLDLTSDGEDSSSVCHNEILGKLFNVFVPQLSHLYNGKI